jgi:hypothetical protein
MSVFDGPGSSTVEWVGPSAENANVLLKLCAGNTWPNGPASTGPSPTTDGRRLLEFRRGLASMPGPASPTCISGGKARAGRLGPARPNPISSDDDTARSGP